LGSGTTFHTTPGKSFAEINQQSIFSLNGELVLIGQDPELREIDVYETWSSRHEKKSLADICQRNRDYNECINRLSKILPDANRGKKYYFRNDIAISDAELEQLRQQRRAVIQQQQEAAGRARQEAASRAQQEAERRRLETEVRLQQEAQARLQEAERIRVQNIKPKLNTTD
jgi:hypothetical protein